MALRKSFQDSLVRSLEAFFGETGAEFVQGRMPGIFGQSRLEPRKSNMYQAIANSGLTHEEQRERLEWANNLDPFDLSAMEKKYDEKTLINIVKMSPDMRQYYIPASYQKRWEKFKHWLSTWLPITFDGGDMNPVLADMETAAKRYLADRQKIAQQQKKRLSWAAGITGGFAILLLAPFLIGGWWTVTALILLSVLIAIIVWRRR